VLENYVGTWEILSIKMFGNFKQVHCSGKFLGKSEKIVVEIACPYLFHPQNQYLYLDWVLALYKISLLLGYPHL
jgi:hypothetical protein